MYFTTSRDPPSQEEGTTSYTALLSGRWKGMLLAELLQLWIIDGTILDELHDYVPQVLGIWLT